MFILTLFSDNIQFPPNGNVEEEIVVSDNFVRETFDSAAIMPIEVKADIVQRGQLDRLATPVPEPAPEPEPAPVVQPKPAPKPAPAPAPVAQPAPASSSGYSYEGNFTITHYCACAICCGKWADGFTATGTRVTAGRTIAVDPNVIPLGTKVWINGHVYTAEDTGGFSGKQIDIYMESHQAALQAGRFTTLVKY